MDAIVLAGGSASRLGGVDKAALVVGGRSLLERALHATSCAGRTVVVGPKRSTSRVVEWAREHPPGGGPVAGLAAGLTFVTSELVAVVAGDMPYLSPAHLERLVVAVEERDGAIVVDATGRDQPLAGVYRTASLRDALDGFAVQGGAMRDVVGRLDVVRLRDDVAALDCDTPEDVERARRMAQRR